ncbi:MAG: hypothetical protein LCH51_00850 [Bacteroidetes bacterium]|nr:hypothetical protein [Bacteroidota bacterium]HOA38419.1 hypothetical protein [Flavihumibacter sp.]
MIWTRSIEKLTITTHLSTGQPFFQMTHPARKLVSRFNMGDKTKPALIIIEAQTVPWPTG